MELLKTLWGSFDTTKHHNLLKLKPWMLQKRDKIVKVDLNLEKEEDELSRGETTEEDANGTYCQCHRQVSSRECDLSFFL